MTRHPETAAPSEIAATVVALHDKIVDAAQHEEVMYSSLVECQSTITWGMDITRIGHLTLGDTRPRSYLPFDTPFEESEDDQHRFSLRLDLPGNRYGSFNLSVRGDTSSVTDELPADPETLSLAGLLNLMGITAPEEAYPRILDAINSGSATRERIDHTIVMAAPIDLVWPNLYVRDTTTASGRKNKRVEFIEWFENAHRTFNSLEFKACTCEIDDSMALETYKYADRRTQEEGHLTPLRLHYIEQAAAETLDKVYGHGCYRYDYTTKATQGLHDYSTFRSEALGLDGQPSKHAQRGYELSRETMPVLR